MKEGGMKRFYFPPQGYSTLTCSMGDDGRPGWNRALPSCQGQIKTKSTKTTKWKTAQKIPVACVTVNLMFDLFLQLPAGAVQQDQRGQCYLQTFQKTILLDRCVSIQYLYRESLVGLNTHTHTHTHTFTFTFTKSLGNLYL